MQSAHTTRAAGSVLAALLMLVLFAASAWAQSTIAPGPAVSPPTGAGPAEAVGDGSGVVVAILLVVGLLVIMGISVKMFDLRQRRDAEAVALQAQISDALLRDSRLANLVITATVHVPTWSGSPATIEVRGEVSTPELRQAVLRLVEEEAARVRTDYRVDDRLMILPRVISRVA